MSWMSDIPVVGSSIDSFLNPQEGYKQASAQMQKMWEQALALQQPYVDAGTSQLPTLTSAESALLNPAALEAQWTSGYTMSPYAEQSMQNAQSSGLDAASSMGLMGSSTAINNIQNSSSDIMNADRQQYLNDLMQKYLAGIGIGQNIYNTGASIAAPLGTQAISTGESLGQGAYGAANAQGELLKQMLALGSKIAMQSQMGAGMAM